MLSSAIEKRRTVKAFSITPKLSAARHENGLAWKAAAAAARNRKIIHVAYMASGRCAMSA